MYPKLTYLLISIALLATSCSSDSPDDISLSKGAELSFNIPDLSRGSVTTDIDHFLVYGDNRHRPFETSAPTLLFNKTKVEYKNDVWGYEGVQYWMPNLEHSFVALNPANIFEADNEPQYLNSQLSFEYSIPAPGGILSNNSDVTDILVATHRRLYGDIGTDATLDSKISLRFSHLLSLINIAPAFDDNILSAEDYIQIYKVEFSGITTKAKFAIQPAPRQSNCQTDDMTCEVSALQNGNIAIEFPTPFKVENAAKHVSLFTDDDAIILLPQNFTADSNAKINIYYSISNEQSTRQVSIPLNNQKWESGSSYMYRFTIERTSVKFNSYEINPWNVIQGEKITLD